MKKLSLITILCFSISLQGSRFTPPAPTHQYAKGAYATVITAKDNLAAYSNALSGLLDQIETTLCGSVSNLSLATPGPLNIDSASGSYTNCNGGDMVTYATVANLINNWSNLLNSENYHAGSADCTAQSSGLIALSPQFATAINGLSSDINNVVNILGNSGYGVVSTDYQGTVIASSPGVVTVSGLGDVISNTMNDLGTAVNGKGILEASAELSAFIDQETDKFNAFVSCQNQAYAAGTCCSNYQQTSYSEDGVCDYDWCPNAFRDYLISWSNLYPVYVALYQQLAKYQPSDIITFSNQSVSSNTVACYGPNVYKDPALPAGICTANGCSVNTAIIGGASILANGEDCSAGNNMQNPECAGTLNGYVNGITTQVQGVQAIISTISDQFASANLRTQAIMNVLTWLSSNLDNTSAQLDNAIKICQADISKEQSYLSNISLGLNLGIGLLIGAVAFTGIGALGVPFLEPLCMALTMMPQVNDYTLGLLTNLDTTAIVNGVVVPSEPKK